MLFGSVDDLMIYVCNYINMMNKNIPTPDIDDLIQHMHLHPKTSKLHIFELKSSIT